MRMKPDGAPSPPHVLQPWADFMDKVSIVVPHLVPLLGVLVLGWSAGAFLVLGLFQLSFSIMSIGVVGVAVSTKREKPDVADADWAVQIGRWVALGAIAVIGSLVLTALFGWVVAIISANVEGALFHRGLLAPAVAMMLAALPGLSRQYKADLAANLGEEVRKARDQPRVGLLLMSCGAYFLLAGYADGFGRTGLCVMAILVTALSILRDWKPELAQILFPYPRPSASLAKRRDAGSRRRGHRK